MSDRTTEERLAQLEESFKELKHELGLLKRDLVEFRGQVSLANNLLQQLLLKLDPSLADKAKSGEWVAQTNGVGSDDEPTRVDLGTPQ